MKAALPLLAALCLLGGCAAPSPHAIVPVEGRPVANLALGRSPEGVRLAEAWTWRSDWPAAEVGQRTEELTFYSTVTYDEQYHYDRFGGLYRGAQTVQTGVRSR